MWIKEEYTPYNLVDNLWSGARSTIEILHDHDITDEQIYDCLMELFPNDEDNPVDITEVNDFVWNNDDVLYDYFGIEL